VVAVICDLIEHVFAAGIHAKKPVESVSGFVEYIRDSVCTGETACVEFIAERFWIIAVRHQHHERRVRGCRYVLEII
jgi:hypothetical protein